MSGSDLNWGVVNETSEDAFSTEKAQAGFLGQRDAIPELRIADGHLAVRPLKIEGIRPGIGIHEIGESLPEEPFFTCAYACLKRGVVALVPNMSISMKNRTLVDLTGIRKSRLRRVGRTETVVLFTVATCGDRECGRNEAVRVPGRLQIVDKVGFEVAANPQQRLGPRQPEIAGITRIQWRVVNARRGNLILRVGLIRRGGLTDLARGDYLQFRRLGCALSCAGTEVA